jgi:hypothetical protein
MSNEEDKRGRLERAFASLRRRMRGEDQKPGEYFKPVAILHSAFESKQQPINPLTGRPFGTIPSIA